MQLVSVIVPMKNAERFVSDALASVLCEKAVPLEVVVVDDGSTDASAKRVTAMGDPRVRIVAGPRNGFAACMNAGLSAARGDIVMECDADDLYPPNRIGEQVRWLADHPQFDAVCGSFTTIDDAGRRVADLRENIGAAPADLSPELSRGVTRTSFCTFALRAALIRRVGGFREYFETGCDVDYQLRVGECGRVAYLPTNVYFYRLHDSSLTHLQGAARRTFYEATARAAQQERQRTGSDCVERGTPPLPPHDDRKGNPAAEHIQDMLLGRAWQEHARGRTREALRTGFRAALVRPRRLGVWKSVLALGIKRARI